MPVVSSVAWARSAPPLIAASVRAVTYKAMHTHATAQHVSSIALATPLALARAMFQLLIVFWGEQRRLRLNEPTISPRSNHVDWIRAARRDAAASLD